MITASQARSMAETRWGRGGTHGYRTNRKGAFYYSCSSHGGYVIDDRCLTDPEREALKKHLSMPQGHTATEIVEDKTGKVVKFRGPDVYRSVTYYAHRQTVRYPIIWFAEEDCDWAVVEHFTPIRIRGVDRDPRPTLEAFFNV